MAACTSDRRARAAFGYLRETSQTHPLRHKSELTDASVRASGIEAPPGGTMAEGRDITAEVKRIIKEQLDVDEKDIKAESTFIDDLGADSLGLVELVLAFEEAFEIDIPDEDTEKIRTVQDAIDYIEKHLSS